MSVTEESGADLVLVAQITEGHGGAMRIGGFNSTSRKGTLVLNLGPSGPRFRGSGWASGFSSCSAGCAAGWGHGFYVAYELQNRRFRLCGI